MKKIIKIKNKLNNVVLALAATFASFGAIAGTTGGGGIGGRLEGLNEEGGILASSLMLLIGIAGTIMLFLGLWGLKKHAENSQQNPLKTPLILTIAGGIMAGFTAFQTLLSESFTGGGLDESTGREQFKAPTDGGN